MPKNRSANGDAFRSDIDRVLFSRPRIAARVGELAREISRHYAQCEQLTIVAVLTGSLIFLADLIRQMPLRLRLDLVSICSYPGPAIRSQGPRFTLPLAADLAGKDVLVVDDILDSGQTLAALLEEIRAQGPASVRACVLLRKDRQDLPHRLAVDFFGFDVANEFVVGYGLDFDHLYRNLPDICVLKPQVLFGQEHGERRT